MTVEYAGQVLEVLHLATCSKEAVYSEDGQTFLYWRFTLEACVKETDRCVRRYRRSFVPV